ncbi:uncharacterized protein UHOD_11229 [Ustilago sp. UG-2017b]|nr:uncharacterized protein UHOD_11229 [Ustilago sp. UG-2017b]
MDGMCGVDSVWQVVCANRCAVESESERVPIPRVARALQKQLESRGSVTLTSTASHVRFRAFYRSGTTERGGLTSLSNLKIVELTSSRSIAVEDASAFSKVDVLDRINQNREIRETPIAKKDEIDAKLVGTYAAYARGLTPWYAGDMLT